MPDSDSWQDLRDRFLAATRDEEPENGGWLAVWRLCIEHPWFQAEVAACAAEVVARSGLPREWCGDVAHDALLLLAKKLRKNPGLGVDPVRADRHFPAWMGTIIRNDCRTAVRRLRRNARERPLPLFLPAADREAERESRIDLRMLIDCVADPERTVLHLSADGLSLQEIAGRLGLSYWQAWRAYRNGIDRLRESV